MDGDAGEILAAGIDHYLTKPVRKADLIERIVAAHSEDQEDPLGSETLPKVMAE